MIIKKEEEEEMTFDFNLGQVLDIDGIIIRG